MHDHMKAEIVSLIANSLAVDSKPRRRGRKASSVTVSGNGNIVAGGNVIHISFGALSDEHLRAVYQAAIGK